MLRPTTQVMQSILQMQDLSAILSNAKASAVSVKSALVDIQGSLNQHSALVNHIAEQQKQMGGRLSLIKTTNMEFRRTKRDNDDLEV